MFPLHAQFWQTMFYIFPINSLMFLKTCFATNFFLTSFIILFILKLHFSGDFYVWYYLLQLFNSLGRNFVVVEKKVYYRSSAHALIHFSFVLAAVTQWFQPTEIALPLFS